MKKIKAFRKYLEQQYYAVATIEMYCRYALDFLTYLDKEGLQENEVRYKEIEVYFFQLKESRSLGLSKRMLLAVRHYYDSLELKKNPASGIYIKQSRRSILSGVMSFEKLKQVHKNYETKSNRAKRNKVILGLLIYQALRSGELQKLRVDHVKIGEHKIEILAGRKTNGRILELDAAQLLELQEYILVVRRELLADVRSIRAGRSPAQIDPLIKEKLFFSERGSLEIKNSLKHMFRVLQKTNPSISSAKVIRSTVIANWLKTRDIRKVQYMCGHRYVSSTERYNAYNLEELKDQLRKYHPLK